MFAKDLMILWISCAVPLQALVCGRKLSTTALATTFGYATVEASDPRFDVGGAIFDEFYTAAIMNGFAIANVGGACEFLNTLKAQKAANRFLLMLHLFIINHNQARKDKPYTTDWKLMSNEKNGPTK